MSEYHPVAHPLPEGVHDNFTYACNTCGGTVTVISSTRQPHTCRTSERMKYEVAELGEDGDAWMVRPGRGWLGGSEESAKLAVVEWLYECVGDDDSALGCHVAALLKAPVTHHHHWAWHTAEPYDDMLLLRLDSAHRDVETFAGWLFSRHIPPTQTISEYMERRRGSGVE